MTFLRQVRKWRRQLHTWDMPPSAGEQPIFTAGPANTFAPAADASPDATATDGREPRQGTGQTADAAADGGDAVCLCYAHTRHCDSNSRTASPVSLQETVRALVRPCSTILRE